MPANALQRQVHSLKHLGHQEIIKWRGQQLDFEFFKSTDTNPKTPEYPGYITCYARELGALKGKKTMTVYTPLIDLTPSDPTIIMTVMIEAKRITSTTGQKHTIFTCDQQLYKLSWYQVGLSKVFSEFDTKIRRNASTHEFYRLHWYSNDNQWSGRNLKQNFFRC